MLLVGLTGGIASGKSVVAARWAEHGAVVVDADTLAREVVEPGSAVLARIANEFGQDVIADDGSLDRSALGAIVFSDPERRRALNDMTHPAIRELSLARIAEATAADPDATIVYDVPLLAEGRIESREFDVVVVVHAPMETRIERMVTHRGMSRNEAESRIRSQATDEERLAIADLVVDAEGTLDETLHRADHVWRQIHQRAVGGSA